MKEVIISVSGGVVHPESIPEDTKLTIIEHDNGETYTCVQNPETGRIIEKLMDA